jgi:hypothetical protein
MNNVAAVIYLELMCDVNMEVLDFTKKCIAKEIKLNLCHNGR